MSVRAIFAALLTLVWAFALGACEGEAVSFELPAMSEVRLGSVTEVGVSGSIASEAFEAIDVRYRVVHRGGREQLELLFSEERIERCGMPIHRPGRLVWLRIPGVTSPDAAAFATDDEAHTLSVHYEVPLEHGYDAVGRGSGRVELVGLDGERLAGRVAVCFADASSSCVRGHFTAYPCYSRIDGRTLRESPGLSDEALGPPDLTRETESAP